MFFSQKIYVMIFGISYEVQNYIKESIKTSLIPFLVEFIYNAKLFIMKNNSYNQRIIQWN